MYRDLINILKRIGASFLLLYITNLFSPYMNTYYNMANSFIIIIISISSIVYNIYENFWYYIRDYMAEKKRRRIKSICVNIGFIFLIISIITNSLMYVINNDLLLSIYYILELVVFIFLLL